MPQTNLYTVTLPPMITALEKLSALLDKVEAHAGIKKSEVTHLLNDRLVFDQLPFIRQVQIACDNAKSVAAKLAEIENPKHEDSEKTIPELKARIEKTVAFLKTIKPEQMIGKEDIKVPFQYVPGKFLTGFEHAVEYIMPNFYFHVTTAYSILRKNGVDIGKMDYLRLALKDL